MATVDDKYILELERQRAKLVKILQSKGVLIDENSDLASAIKQVENIGQNDLLSDFIGGNLTEFELTDPNATQLGYNPFASIANIVTKLNLPYVENVKHIFSNTTGIQGSQLLHLNIPNLKTGSDYYELGNMPKLVNIVAPSLVSGRANDFGIIAGDLSLVRFVAPNYINGCRLSGNSSPVLTLVDVSRINFEIITYPAMKTLILRNTTQIANLTVANAFPNDVEIYIPQEMIEKYKVATNWTVYADKFVALEGSKYESLTWYLEEDWYKEEMAVWQ